MAIDVPMADGTLQSMILKRFNIRSAKDRVAHALRPSPARRSWQSGHALLNRLLPTATPWLLHLRYRNGFEAEGFLLCERLTGREELQRVAGRANGRAEKDRLLESLAVLVRTTHRRGLRHLDLKAPNILAGVDASGRFDGRLDLIDLVGVRRVSRPSSAMRQRDLMRLVLSFARLPQFTRTDFRRFLRTYLFGEGGEDWRVWWRTIESMMRKKRERAEVRKRPIV